jgi:serine protease
MYRLLFAVALVAAATTSASAAIIAVPGDHATIQSAINASANGDTILVSPGTYNGSINFNNKLVALRSTQGAQQTTISVNGGTAVTIGGAAQITGFTITGAVDDFGAGMVVEGVGTLVKNNIFVNNRQTAGGFGAAIGGNSASPVIDGNLFRNHTADSQHLSGVVSFVNSSSPTTINNVFVDNPTRAINLTLPAGNNPRVFNNTFVRNQTAIKYGSFPPDTAFRNNILAQNTIGIELDYPYDVPVWENNLVWNNGTNYLGMPNQTGLSGNVSVDPRFLDPQDNFQLALDSPAIDAGTSLGGPDHDFLGRPRPMGAAPDLGAYETVPEPSLVAILPLFALLARRPVRPS